MFPRVVRISISVILTGLLIFIFRRVLIVNNATIALILILEILCISVWGRAQAFAAALVAGLGLEYRFLPPNGFAFRGRDRLITFGAFIITALATSYTTHRMKLHRMEAVARREEAEKLNKMSNAIFDSEDAESVLSRLPDYIVEIFGAAEVALYDQTTGRFVRSGSPTGVMPESKLREVALHGERFKDFASGVFLLPIRRGGKLAGSLGIKAEACSEELIDRIAEQVSTGLAKAHAAEKEMAAEVARRTDELKSAVLDALMHEIKSPLAAMNIAVSTLLSVHHGSEAQQSELLGAIKRDMDRLNRRIDEAVRMAQIRSGEFSLDRKWTCVSDIIFDSLQEMAIPLEGRPVQTDLADPLPAVDCDVAMIKHVLNSLLDNAVKYSPPGSAIIVQGGLTGQQIIVSVTSAGQALAEDERERVFEKYYRGWQARSSGVAGTGLGLASAKSIVEAHNGGIWTTSESGGNTFHFSLPATERGSYDCYPSTDRR